MKTYEEYASEARSTLEILCVRHHDQRHRMKAFAKLLRNFESNGLYFDGLRIISTPDYNLYGLGFDQVRLEQKRPTLTKQDATATLTIPSMSLVFTVAHLSGLSGKYSSIFSHELGEIIFNFPFQCYAHQLVGKPEPQTRQKPIDYWSLSCECVSDVYGDLVSSALSPMTADGELSLIGKDLSHLREEIKMSQWKYDYIIQHIGRIRQYWRRDKEGYEYGETAVEYYLAILKMQVGMLNKQRLRFLLDIYDTTQEMQKNHIIPYDGGVRAYLPIEDIIEKLTGQAQAIKNSG